VTSSVDSNVKSLSTLERSSILTAVGKHALSLEKQPREELWELEVCNR